jgi:branched-chain amino acid transport system ATP-binding protein
MRETRVSGRNSTQADPLLTVVDLEVVYGQYIRGLSGVSLEVRAGEIVALLGANGAGKTTLLRSATGLLRFHEGEVTGGTIELHGHDTTHASPNAIVRSGVAQVMEGRRIFGEMTVEDNLAVGAIVCGDRRAMAARREEMYGLFPVLADRRTSQAGYLSGGEQQMLAIGRALMSSPTMLLLDEPSLGLAPMVVEQIRDVVTALNDQGTTVLLVEQNAVMALSISDRAYILRNGVVVMSGESADLRDDPSVQALYLGTNTDGSRDSYRSNRAGATKS